MGSPIFTLVSPVMNDGVINEFNLEAEPGEITVDYEGTSPASPWGINVVKNYTHAYTTFTVRSVLNPDIPNNHGSLGPIKVKAPEGSISRSCCRGRTS